MNWYLVPLTAVPQSFQIALAGVNYLITVKWNNTSDGGGWQFDLTNADTNTPLIAGAPFITGADLLDGLNYLGINGHLFVYTNGMPDAVPTFTNLGTDSNLYFVTSAATN